MNKTIEYYNNNAEEYYNATIDVDFTDAYERFLKYIPEGGRIIDLGCGSGRDAAAFAKKGYDVVGLDASEKLAEIAEREHGIPVIIGSMADWIADKPFDGIWCCAALLHLDDDSLQRFFQNLKYNLKSGGAIYISVKSGIETGIDKKGRFMRDFKDGEIEDVFAQLGIEIVGNWSTGDQLDRNGFYWINLIGIGV